MEVTRENFQSVLEKLQEDIEESTFLTIDTEFTGLEDGLCRFSGLDTPVQRYQKVKQSSMQFLIVQFGLSTYKCDKSSKRIIYKTYNFYVFPTTNSRLSGSSDLKFLSQASSISFLASHGFDFNKLFREGIPFVSLVGEEKLRSNLLEKYENQELNSSADIPEIPGQQKSFIEDVMANIKNFLAKETDDTDNILVVSDCNAFQRKLILSHARRRFPDGYLESKRTEKMESVIVVQKASMPDTRQRLIEKSRMDDEKALNTSLGFSRVIRMISESKKPVVGHNMLLDLCHIINQFYSPLPDDYEDFKLLVNTIFPRLIDTKVMATTQPFRDLIPNSGLEALAKTVSKKPFKFPEYAPASGFPSYDLEDKKAHEAGYDSFVTGLCFASMLSYLNGIQSNVTENSSLLDVESPLLAPFFQKVFLMMVSDIPYLSLGGPDVVPDRDHVFHMTIPKAWKAQDIYQLFSVFGPVRLNWIGDTSCFVTLVRKDNKDLVMTSLTPPQGCTIVPYVAFHNNTRSSEEEDAKNSTGAGSHTPAENTTRARKRSSAESKTPDAKRKKDESKISNHFEVSNDWD